MTALIAIAFAGAALVSWLIVGAVIRAAPRLGLVDRPNERSLHRNPTPRGGGIGIVAVVLAGWPLAIVFSGGWPALDVWWLVLLGFAVAAVSVADDRSPIPATLRLVVHVAFAAGAVTTVGSFELIHVPGAGIVTLGALGVALTLVWILGLTNVTNFMDGIDGIAGLQCMIAGIAWTAAGLWLGDPVAALGGIVIAGACAGFLFHNWSPAQIFMGDVGSAFLGFMLAMIPVLASLHALVESPLAAARIPVFGGLILWPFIGDGVFTFLRRLVRRENVLRAHRSHLYQRLVLAGWSHARVSLLYGAWAVLMSAAALIHLTRSGRGIASAVVAVVSLAAVWLLVQRAESRSAGKNLE
ncbi:MAG TPA: glycosyltransferase family 4 protein [Opitutaceae bacterium]|nr:glycosyltransferase family 4 protein [Opitutaceae bacterium]